MKSDSPDKPLKPFELLLASQSPRRQELLQQAGYKFHVDSVKVSEIIDENLNPKEAIMALALQKAQALVRERKHLNLDKYLVLSADTMVCLKDRLLGKPENSTQAREFLDLLSGKTHSVITGFCLLCPLDGSYFTDFDETFVLFKSLTAEEIEKYVLSGEPMDKAGAYAIQGEGAKFVREYRGSWSNVVGLPLEKLEIYLTQKIGEKGWSIEKRGS